MRKLLPFLFLALVLVLVGRSPVSAQTLIYDTNNAPANLPAAAAAAAPAAGGTLISGSGMRDDQGGVFAVNASHQIVGTPEGSSSWQRDNLFFGNQGTGQTGHTVEVITYPAGQTLASGPELCYQGPGTKYWVYLGNPAASTFGMGFYKEIAGADTNLGTTNYAGGAGIWQIVADRNGSTLTVSAYNLTTPGGGQATDPVTVNPDGTNGARTLTVTDSILTSGGFGLAVYAAAPAAISRVRLYAQYLLSATGTVTASTAGNSVTLANGGTAYVSTTPSAYALSGAGAAGSSVTAVALSNAGQTATLTVTAGATLGTLTITDPNSQSASVAVTGPPALAIGRLRASAAQAGVTLTLTANGAGVVGLAQGSGAGYSYAVYRDTLPATSPGPATLLATLTNLGATPYLDATAAPGVTYYYRVVGRDGAGGAAYTVPDGLAGTPQTISLATVAVMPQAVSLALVSMGDSITCNIINGANGPTDAAPVFSEATELMRMGGVRNVWALNAGSNGSTTVHNRKDATPGTNNMGTAAGTLYNPGGGALTNYGYASNMMTALIAAHPGAKPVFTVMLGTNDSRQEVITGNGTPMSPATYQANLVSIGTSFLTDFPSAYVCFNYSPYYTPNSFLSTAIWGEAGLAALSTFYPRVDAAVAALNALYPGRAILGDRTAPQFFGTNYLTEMVAQTGSDTAGNPSGVLYLHPTSQGSVDLGKLWALPVYSALVSPPQASAAPLTLTATAGVNSEVLTWTADSGATNGYEVDWKPSSVLPVAGQVKSIVAIVGPGVLTWTDTSAYRLAQSGRYNVVGLH